MFRFFAVTSPILYSQHRHCHTPAYVTIFLCWAASLTIGICCCQEKDQSAKKNGSFRSRYIFLFLSFLVDRPAQLICFWIFILFKRQSRTILKIVDHWYGTQSLWSLWQFNMQTTILSLWQFFPFFMLANLFQEFIHIFLALYFPAIDWPQLTSSLPKYLPTSLLCEH